MEEPGMDHRGVLSLAFCLTLGASLLALDPVVSNVLAQQRAGTKLVDITYDLTDPDSGTLNVTVRISKDGGATWTVPCRTLSGNGIGVAVTPGTGKAIVWDAGADWNGQWSDHMQAEVVATDVGDDFVLIPGGTFSMGDTFSEGGTSERPVHPVSISAFYLGRYEVTKALWDEVRAWGPANGYTDLPAGAVKATGHPVQTVDWYGAVKWCNARSQKEGLTPCYYTGPTFSWDSVYRRGTVSVQNGWVDWTANGYRLPTEAEWEYAARGGVAGRRFPWGNTISHGYANYNAATDYPYDESYPAGYHPDYDSGGYPYTSPVGSFPVQGAGHYDMIGNVWEWCWDWYGATYYQTCLDQGTVANPRGPASGSSRVLRGGNWYIDALLCRLARRHTSAPDNAVNSLGFRLVRAAP
jgi:formylglycine-generating enzyme required for sulfatase activity